MENKKEKNADMMVYACAGCSDVGHISYLTAKKLAAEGYARMNCLAGVGAHIASFVKQAEAAGVNIAIDGCPVACARKILEHIEIPLKSFILTEMGLVKGAAPVDDKNVSEMAEKIKSRVTPSGEPEQTGCDCGGLC